MPCIFCGAQETSETHIFPKRWISDIAPGVGPFEHKGAVEDATGVIERRAWKSRSGPKAAPGLTVKCTCRTCNSEWMSVLEQDAQKVMETMMGRQKRVIGETEKAALSSWAALVTVLLDQTSPEPRVTLEQHHWMCANHAPPPGFYIWAGENEQIVPTVFSLQLYASPRVGPEVVKLKPYLATFRIKDLVFHIFAAIGVEAFPWLGLVFSPYLHPIWPPTFEPLNWPPRVSFTDDTAVEALIRSFVSQ